MFIQNQIDSLPNHLAEIKKILKDADRLLITVSYIRNSGLDLIIDDVVATLKKGRVQVICSSDMGITESSALRRLLDLGVEIKICQFEKGTFHAKLWLAHGDDGWRCVVGSANCSKSALEDNVEASLRLSTSTNINGAIEQALIFFDYLWNSKYCTNLTYEFLDTWQERENSRAKVRKQKENIITVSPPNSEISNLLFNYAKSWLDISKARKQRDNRLETLWRGWYIIPDQDLINDATMRHLQKVLKYITDNRENDYFDIAPDSLKLTVLLKMISTKFKRGYLKTGPRELFVRQEKNYLVKFNFLAHKLRATLKEDSNKLLVTDLGIRFIDSTNIEAMKQVYSESMIDYTWGSAHIYSFTVKLLLSLNYLSVDEFSLFVMHSYADNEYSDTKELVQLFRRLNFQEQRALIQSIRNYFEEVKEGTAKNVMGNYFKHAKYNMSALGWVQGANFDPDRIRLQLSDRNKLLDLLGKADVAPD